MKIQKELDETKIVLHKTIESVLERGEKIDTLVEKSDGLNAQSKMFYKQVCFSLRRDFSGSLFPKNGGLGLNHIYLFLGQETKFMLCCHVIYQAQ